MRSPVGVALAGTLLLAGCVGGGTAAPRTTTITVPPPPAPPIPTVSGTVGTTTPPPAKPPRTYDEALARVAAGTVMVPAVTRFVSPTGNIACDITVGAGAIGCELKDGRVSPPTPQYCATAGGAPDVGRVQLTAAGATAVCNTDSIAAPGAPTLPYGSVAKTNDNPVACLSESIGMTCVDTSTKKGFFIQRGAYLLF